jgi:hypothetical protein
MPLQDKDDLLLFCFVFNANRLAFRLQWAIDTRAPPAPPDML